MDTFADPTFCLHLGVNGEGGGVAMIGFAVPAGFSSAIVKAVHGREIGRAISVNWHSDAKGLTLKSPRRSVWRRLRFYLRQQIALKFFG